MSELYYTVCLRRLNRLDADDAGLLEKVIASLEPTLELDVRHFLHMDSGRIAHGGEAVRVSRLWFKSAGTLFNNAEAYHGQVFDAYVRMAAQDGMELIVGGLLPPPFGYVFCDTFNDYPATIGELIPQLETRRGFLDALWISRFGPPEKWLDQISLAEMEEFEACAWRPVEAFFRGELADLRGWLCYLGPDLAKVYPKTRLLEAGCYRVEDGPRNGLLVHVQPGITGNYPSDLAWKNATPVETIQARLGIDVAYISRFEELFLKFSRRFYPHSE